MPAPSEIAVRFIAFGERRRSLTTSNALVRALATRRHLLDRLDRHVWACVLLRNQLGRPAGVPRHAAKIIAHASYGGACLGRISHFVDFVFILLLYLSKFFEYYSNMRDRYSRRASNARPSFLGRTAIAGVGYTAL